MEGCVDFSGGNYGIENTLQKGFRVVRHFLGSRIVEKIEIDNTSGNKNVPEEELKIDIEGKSIFLSKGVCRFVDHLFKNGPKRISSWEMGRNAMSCSRRPKHYISRWIDFNEKFGLGYQLSDSSVGVNFKDNSRLVVDGSMENYQYIDKNGARVCFDYDKCPTNLGKRCKLLEYFKNYMENNLLAEPPAEEHENIEIVDTGTPILLKWKRNDKCICFILLNGVFQINFLEDHTKFIISIPTSSISIIDKDNKLKTYCLEGLINGGVDAFTEEKMFYIKKVIDEWTSLKRRHEGNDDVVVAKKSNNNK
uniref:Polo kinase n=1 Tax=Strongyloides papillosus TaxID=174720 RepID=A0A0N5BED0_STREA